MTKRRLFTWLGIAAALLIAAWAIAPAQEELDSVKVCPDTQKVVVENTFVRVIDDRIPVGVMEQKHRHAHGVTVALTDYDIESTTYPAGKTTKSHRSSGEINWTEPTVHTVKNVGSTPSHAVRIELKY